MSLTVVIIRPLDSAHETAQRAIKLGLKPVIDPLFRVEAVDWEPPLVSAFDALMVTSANALNYGGTGLSQYKRLPVLAVGAATATVARQMGFNVQKTGEDGAQALLNSLSSGQYRRILRLVGKDHVPLNSSDRGIEICIVYRSIELPLGQKAREAMTTKNVILLHSARAASLAARECDRLEIDRSNCHIVALSPKVGKAAGTGWAGLDISRQPTDDALLALASRLCRGQQANNV